ncbi:hypothetical protein [Hydrogenovibrio marinus]|uniref:Uncharacterized protein n=2 Tax=Hydrogenovibrio marinus TaxID=28885 RepID=A0A066ZND0_HYDMR|nr:hypothetical protein [Hydrogenovibrio marinus]KDN95027.1 hypothetical protein EI16_01570 [Hydrogenovibrio marinus]BBN59493.1 hypothetical protein HVMH_1087 [Hydrogenovibrio marinus]
MDRIMNKVWVYWFITDILLILDVSGWHYGLPLATALTVIQIIHFYAESKSISAFPVQVRIAYTLLLLVAFWAPMYWVLYFVILGTTAMVLFDYCFLARFMSLMPWNHNERYSVSMVFRTFFSKPISGSVQKI